ncbi:MAG: TIGR00266 family protein [Actinobacteria bacterium]|nr:TIGR00266 family protein [Actinomycetota bacterium]
MEVNLLFQPSYTMANVKLSSGEEIKAESGAMVSMTEGIALETKMQGGFFKALGRSVLGGESFFMNTFKAGPSGGEVNFAPALPGDMFVIDLEKPMLVQSGSYIASENSVDIDTKFGGAKTFFASEGLFLLKASGSGKLLLSSFGAINEILLADGEKHTVDTGHFVAFDEGVGFNVRKIGGMRSTLFSGEGLVVDITGPGRILIQSRSQDSFLGWLIPKLPKNNS